MLESVRKERGVVVAGVVEASALSALALQTGMEHFWRGGELMLTPVLSNVCPQVNLDWVVSSYLGHRLHPGKRHSL